MATISYTIFNYNFVFSSFFGFILIQRIHFQISSYLTYSETKLLRFCQKKKKTSPLRPFPPHPYQSRRLRSPPFQPHSLHRSPGKMQVAKWLAPWVSLETSQNPNKETTYQHQTKKQNKNPKQNFCLTLSHFFLIPLTEPVLEDCSVASRPAAPAAHSTWHGLLPPFMLAI